MGNPVRRLQVVHYGAESFEFIFGMNGLDDAILISTGVKIIKGIEVYAVNPFCGMPFRNKILFRGLLRGEMKKEKEKPSAVRNL